MVSYYDLVLIVIPIVLLTGMALQPVLDIYGLAVTGFISLGIIIHALFVNTPNTVETANTPSFEDKYKSE